MRHLTRLCNYTSLTDMTAKNLAIVWAPNLFRAPPVLDGDESHMLSGLDVHTSLCNYLITNSSDIFVDGLADVTNISGNECAHPQPSPISSRDDASPCAPEKLTPITDKNRTNKFRWSNFLRGRSVETFFKSGRRPTVNGLLEYSSSELVEWNRSHSVETSLQCSRSDSIMSFMSRGVGELRDGIRVLRQRARSLRRIRRPHSSLAAPLRLCSDSVGSANRDEFFLPNAQDVQCLATSSTASHLCEEQDIGNRSFLSTQSDGRGSTATSASDSPCFLKAPDDRKKRVNFPQTEPETREYVIEDGDKPLYERSSPIEEWSSDSRDSPLLEMSRYDNVPCTGSSSRELTINGRPFRQQKSIDFLMPSPRATPCPQSPHMQASDTEGTEIDSSTGPHPVHSHSMMRTNETQCS